MGKEGMGKMKEMEGWEGKEEKRKMGSKGKDWKGREGRKDKGWTDGRERRYKIFPKKIIEK